jgi:hypothetical protein
MNKAVKVMVIAGLLATSGAFAQSTVAVAKEVTSESKTQPEQLVMDAKHHQEMMTHGMGPAHHGEMMARMCPAHRGEMMTQGMGPAYRGEMMAQGMGPAHHGEIMAHRRASDEQVEALQKSVKSLSTDVANVPQYLPQDNPNRP